MKQLEIPFSTGKLPLNIPEENLLQVLTANPCGEACAEQAELQRAMENPIGTDRLCQMAKPGQKVAIVTSDITRPMPTYKVLPFVPAELEKAGIPDEDITVVFALGSHRPHTDAEKEKLVLLIFKILKVKFKFMYAKMLLVKKRITSSQKLISVISLGYVGLYLRLKLESYQLKLKNIHH